MMRLTDSHCHLDYLLRAGEDLAQVVARARAQGVERMITIATREDRWDDVYAIAADFEGVDCTVGVHPHEAHKHQHLTLERLLDRARAPKVVGLGETGIDLHYSGETLEAQRALFLLHIEAARQTGLPVVVHARAADAEILEVLEDAGGDVGIVMHCFSGGVELAERTLALGAYLSFSGIVTFRNAEEVRAAARLVPLERLLVETDSPYLAPVPHRGKPCEPAYTRHTAEALAVLKQVPLEALAAHTHANAAAVFRAP